MWGEGCDWDEGVLRLWCGNAPIGVGKAATGAWWWNATTGVRECCDCGVGMLRFGLGKAATGVGGVLRMGGYGCDWVATGVVKYCDWGSGVLRLGLGSAATGVWWVTDIVRFLR